MEWITEPFGYAFMQRALLGGILAVVTTSVIGTWVVIRGMTFIGDALAHGVLPGIALAVIWGADLRLGAFVSAMVMVAGVGVVNRRANLPEDTGIGLLFVGMLALGVIIISSRGSYAGDLSAILFGDILGVTAADLRFQWAAAAVVVACVVVGYRPFLALSFNADKAWSLGMRPRIAHAAMLGLVALSIVSSFQSVGALLVFGLLVAPPATASLLVRRVPLIMITGVVLGVGSVVVGLLVSYHAGTAASATMAFTAVALFFVVLTVKELVRALRPRLAPVG
ncbi:MAG: zinc ABC transporter permease AztB [Acidimicrobiales bacterium]